MNKIVSTTKPYTSDRLQSFGQLLEGVVNRDHSGVRVFLDNLKKSLDGMNPQMFVTEVSDYRDTQFGSLLGQKVIKIFCQLHPSNHCVPGLTPAHVAAAQGDLEMLQILDEYGFDLSSKTLFNFSPLMAAFLCRQTTVEAVQFLLDRGNKLEDCNDWNAGVRSFVIHSKSESLLDYLLAQNVNFFQPDNGGNVPVARMAVAWPKGCAKLLRARPELKQFLREPNRFGLTILHKIKEVGTLRLLAEIGMLSDILNSPNPSIDVFGNTPMHHMAIFADMECLKEMMRKHLHHIGPDKRNIFGQTFAHFLAQRDAVTDDVRRLSGVDNGDIVDIFGFSPKEYVRALNAVKSNDQTVIGLVQDLKNWEASRKDTVVDEIEAAIKLLDSGEEECLSALRSAVEQSSFFQAVKEKLRENSATPGYRDAMILFLMNTCKTPFSAIMQSGLTAYMIHRAAE